MHLQLGLKQCIGTTEGWALARPLRGCAKAQPAVLLIHCFRPSCQRSLCLVVSHPAAQYRRRTTP